MEPTQPRSNRTWSEGQLYRSGGWGYRSRQLEVGVSMLAQTQGQGPYNKTCCQSQFLKKKFLVISPSVCTLIHGIMSCHVQIKREEENILDRQG